MLSLESQIIDATTEDGKKLLHDFEEQEKQAKTEAKGKEVEENPLAAEID